MTDKINQKKANEYYNQCGSIYAKYVSDHGSNNEISLPDPMDDNFSVPANYYLLNYAKKTMVGLIIGQNSINY